MSRHSKQYFHETMDRGNSRNGSVPVMSTYPIGQSVIDMTSVCVCVCVSDLARTRR